ncbi:MAG: hypothetical protein KAT35_02075, partial [Candidatus Aenigmarchaeota archaeon]|nr:hypothetical protein [Candidatus Aenigmarchaeota archaeon]
KEPLGIVLNRTGEKHELRPEEIEAMCGSRVIGSIPEDKDVRRSISSMNPVVHERPYSRSSVAFSEIAAGLSGTVYKRPRMIRVKRMLRGVRKGSSHDRSWIFPLIDNVRSEVHKEAPRPKRKVYARSRREKAIRAVRNLRVGD